ncbi:Uncharacterised protein [Edwardsiella hoshinae]|uniref:Uncharacterized protein n=1 Tax=Edwardsiella hoshinae TaxID=93378 RepID=A0A376J0X5_9GAMM|nr:Uncharacterised protein [Edwardsiella hoshinae]
MRSSRTIAPLSWVFLESSTGTAAQAVVKPAQWGDALFNTLDELQGKATALYDAAMSPVQKTKRLPHQGESRALYHAQYLDDHA